MTTSTPQRDQTEKKDKLSQQFTLVDAEARERALDIQRSICVTAPAGSGKTELLTQRILKLLAVVDTPESILAITFTRKAAAEMRERVMAALQLGLSEQPPQEAHRSKTWQLARAVLERDQQYQWELLGNPGRLRLQTIDSLCQSITSDLPVLSQLGAKLAPVDQPAPLYQMAVDAFIGELDNSIDNTGADNQEIKSLIGKVLLHLDNNVSRLQRLLIAMLPIRDQWLSHALGYESSDRVRATLEETLQQWFEQELSLLAEQLQPWESELCMLADFAASQLLQRPDKSPGSNIRHLHGCVALPPSDIQSYEQWRGLLELLYTSSGTLRKKFDVRQGFPPKTEGADAAQKAEFDARKQGMSQLLADLATAPEQLQRQLDIVNSLPGHGYQQQHWQILEPLTLCLVRVVAHLRVVFGHTGQCDFNEITASALRALQADAAHLSEQSGTDIAYKWHQNIQHILVDEFQDTSVAQFELLQVLTAEWQQENASGSGPIKTLFVVGDGMQSIYRFRAAQVGLFLRAKSQGIGDLPLENIELVQNFRSSEAIVEWNNRQFAAAFPEHTDISRGAVPYAAAQSIETVIGSAAVKVDNAGSAVDVVIASGDNAAQAEAAHIVSAIQSYQRDQSLKSIAILVRSRGCLQDILPALNEAEIAWQGIDLVPLKNREVVIDCLSLTRALINPVDQIAWLALIRAPWCGLALPDIQALVDSGKAASLAQFILHMPASSDPVAFAAEVTGLSVDGQKRLAHVSKIFSALWQTRERKTLRQWVEAAWLQLNGPLIASQSVDGDDRESARAYFDLLEQLEQECAFAETVLNVELIEQRLDKLFAESAAFSVDAQQELALAPVQIMTIHKSKGLEFDAVIIPGLDRKAPADALPILAWQEHIFDSGQSGLVLCPVDATASYAGAEINRGMDDDAGFAQAAAGFRSANAQGKNTSAELYEFLRTENRRAGDYEMTRLLYVAATRARSRLLLTAKLPAAVEVPQSIADLKKPTGNSLLARLWTGIADEAVLLPFDSGEMSESSADEDAPDVAVFKRLKADALDSACIDSSGQFLSSQHEQQMDQPQASAANETLPIAPQSDATVVGTCIHEIFEQIASQGLTQWSRRSWESREPLWRLRLQQMGVNEQKLDDAMTLVEQAVNNASSSEHGRWIFAESHRLAANEWALSHRQDASTIRRYVIDRSFIDDQGCRWVIDYKIAQPHDQSCLDAFIAQQQQHYSAQLKQYRTLVALFDQAQRNDVSATRTALYLPLIDQLIEIE